MKTHADKSQEDKNRSKADNVSQKQRIGEDAFQFKDNRSVAITQRKLQGLATTTVVQNQPIQKRVNFDSSPSENKTGIPDDLKLGIENLSGHSMDDVNVHYNSGKPAQLHAHAFAQGNQIHLASGQEKHLPHEAWHVVQQKQGRVKPTMQMKGKININDDAVLEKEADVMGGKALEFGNNKLFSIQSRKKVNIDNSSPLVIQGRWYVNSKGETYWINEGEEVTEGRFPPEGYKYVREPSTREGERRAPGYIHGTASIPEILDSGEIRGGSAASKIAGPKSKEVMKEGKGGGNEKPQDLHFFTTDESNNEDVNASLGRITKYYSDSTNDNKKKKSKELSLAAIVRRGLPVPGVLVFSRDIELLKGFHPGTNQYDHSSLEQIHPINRYPVISCDKSGYVELNKMNLTQVRLLNKYDLLSVIFILRMGGKLLANIVPLVQWANEHEVTKKSVKEGLVDNKRSIKTQLIEKCLSGLLKIIPVDKKDKLNALFGRTSAIEEICLAHNKFCQVGMGILSELESSLFKLPSMPEAQESPKKLRSSMEKMDDLDSRDVYSRSDYAYKAEKRQNLPYQIVGELDSDARWSLADTLEIQKFQTDRMIFTVSGANWTCYIRSILFALGSIDKIEEVLTKLGKTVDISSGVIVGSNQEKIVQKAIEKVTGINYHANVISSLHNNPARSKTAHGKRIDLLHSGVHFSWLI